MSNRYEREAEDLYEAQNDASPVPGNVYDSSYVSDTRPELRDQLPVQADQEDYDDPFQPPYSNSNEQLGMHYITLTWIEHDWRGANGASTEEDEKEAINKSNILEGDRTRHAKPQSANRYNEGPDEEDLPDYARYGTSGVSGTKRLS